MNYLSICAILKNEGPYLEEWLEFHILQGVQHFYLYDNGSTDNTRDILKEYGYKGLVDWIGWPGEVQQLAAYSDALTNHKEDTKWLAFIDGDEFLMANVGTVASELTFYEAYSAVAVHWIVYGSSYKKEKGPGLVIERFTLRSSLVDTHVKSIVQPQHVLSTSSDPHSFRFNAGHRCVDENYQKLPEDYATVLGNKTADRLRINHYCTKSREEAMVRWAQKNPDGTTKANDMDYYWQIHDLNFVEDLSAYKFAPAVNRNIKLRREIC